MKEYDFEKLEEFLDEILAVESRLRIPVIEIQSYEARIYKLASENPKDIEMLKFGIRMIHKIYEANNVWNLYWMDTLEKETYRALEEYVF